jgi:hypothetical protein
VNRCSKLASAGMLCLLSGVLIPISAWADKGSGNSSGGGNSGGGGSNSGSSGSGHGGSSGSSSSSASHGSGDSSGTSGGDSGESRHGRDDRKGSVSGSEDRAYDGGWRERISNGRYELFDPDGRLVIRRAAKGGDIDRHR